MSESTTDAAPLIWRVPPYQPAALFLVVCAAAAVNIYAHPSHNIRLVTLFFGVVALGYAIAALRMHLIADSDGVAVRRFRREVWIPWVQVGDIEVVDGVRGASTVRVSRVDGTYVDVPPSLLQPGKPTSKVAARALLEVVARQLHARRLASR
jgi:hypothetical protein